ncbi:MAG: hypothetical protein MPEBLZ_01238 [Candidatus Methanoperedens nitroreducens]|uniref:Uncharacterized protein n=1 Tax=Candidatus Methanoperedens nitratireducens TaxID=1392998 RepID=A0A0P7ZJW9_9EURY|nr:MAG: hypothetical protein MPEBLZ_01238 [Candidatus Methanoperedens sp. BLZ1]CAG0961373.1 hypothetical protein METP2_00812 [Methanosarcinales archaeon]
MSIFNYENKKPQMNADERRFVDFNLIFAVKTPMFDGSDAL